MSYNEKIIYNLNILYNDEILNNNIFKANAYKKIIEYINNNDIIINNLDDIKDIKGIGKSILEKIKEIIDTGKLNKVEEIIKTPKYILGIQLSNIYGIGPSKIKELINKISSFNELKLEENKKLLNDKQQIGLKYYDDLLLRIPISEAKKHNTLIKKELNKINNDLEFEFVGSFRRKMKSIGDIDILIKYHSNFNLKEFIKTMIDNKYILDILAIGNNKFMGICKLNSKMPARRIDILVSNENNYYYALLYFTGSYNFNIYIRNIALKQDYSLSEYGFKDNKTKKMVDITINNEKNIFDFLKIEYIEPEKRI